MKLLFAIADGGGNVPPQLRVACALRARGAQILVVGHPGVRKYAEQEDLSFEQFDRGHDMNSTTQRPLASMMIDFVRVMGDPRIGEAVVDAARRHGSDAVIVDMLFGAGTAEIVKSGLPTVVFVHCFYRAVQDFMASPAGRLLKLRGVAPHPTEDESVLQIVSADAHLDPAHGHPSVRHVGVVWQGTPKQSQPAEVPRILVSLSTCAFAGQRRMLQRIVDALAPLPVEAIVTTGPGIDASRLRIPPNARVHSWLDHDEVLADASAVVGHGGHSTTMRALSFGVPVVVMPANPFIDQKRVGKAVARAGAGRLLGKHARPKRIRAAVTSVLAEPHYRQAATEIGDRIRRRDGAVVAADAVEQFVGRRAGHSNTDDRGIPTRQS